MLPVPPLLLGSPPTRPQAHPGHPHAPNVGVHQVQGPSKHPGVGWHCRGSCPSAWPLAAPHHRHHLRDGCWRGGWCPPGHPVWAVAGVPGLGVWHGADLGHLLANFSLDPALWVSSPSFGQLLASQSPRNSPQKLLRKPSPPMLYRRCPCWDGSLLPPVPHPSPAPHPGNPALPKRDTRAGWPPMGLQQIPATCEGLETPSEPHRGGSPRLLLLQRLRRRETRKAEVGKPSFHSVTPSPWTRGNDNDHNFRKDLMLSIALRYCL